MNTMNESSRMEDKKMYVMISPAYEQLTEEISRMRAELTMLILERDELQFVTCANLEMEYMLKLGYLEYKAYQAQCSYLRMKRKTELIQAKLNRQEIVNQDWIDSQLDTEFEQYSQEMKVRMDSVNQALERSQSDTLSSEEAAELKKLYHVIVKKLHPDLNPDEDEEKVHLFVNAVSAYKNGDLDAMRILNEMAKEAEPDTEQTGTITDLETQKQNLSEMLSRIRSHISKIKDSYPYNQKQLLENRTLLDARREEIEKACQDYKDATEEYRLQIERMMKS